MKLSNECITISKARVAELGRKKIAGFFTLLLKLGEIFQILILGSVVKSEVRFDRNKLISHWRSVD